MLNREYSMMARLGVAPDREKMSGRDFFYHTDMIQKDIAEEDKARKMKESMQRAQRPSKR